MELQLARLESKVEAGFREITRRLDGSDTTLREIRTETRATNGRVFKVEGQIRHLFQMVREKAEVVKDKAESVGAQAGVTRRDVTVFLAGGGALIFAWRFVEWAWAHLPRVP